MEFTLSKNCKIDTQHFGKEQAPIMVVDNFVSEIDALVAQSTKLTFERNSPFYPGLRAKAPDAYQALILEQFKDQLIQFFELPKPELTFKVCHYSIINTPPQKLKLLQRIPHFDSIDKNGLAAVHYLFKEDLGGTSFYRHKKTGYESINEERQINYFRSLESENGGPNMPKISDGYINGNSPLFERIAEQPAQFNRLIIYRRNSLHSGSIPQDMFINDKPKGDRLSISSFIDCA